MKGAGDWGDPHDRAPRTIRMRSPEAKGVIARFGRAGELAAWGGEVRRGFLSSLKRVFSVCTLLLLLPTLAFAQQKVKAPGNVRVFDTPNDGGGALTLVWSAAPYDDPSVRYQILLVPGDSNGAATEKKVIAEFPANSHYVRETKLPWWTRPGNPNDHQYDVKSGKGVELKTGTPYSLVVAVVKGADRAEAPAVQAIPGPNWINWNQMNNLLLVLLFGGVVFWSIKTARRREIFLRRIPGLDAVDEAIGRATELGKPILYLTGAGDMSEPSTIAAAVILGRVGKRVAAYETQLMVPHRDPIVMAVCQEVTKQAYLEAGKPDAFKEDSNFFITGDQFSYTAAVDGLMLRRRPAANFFMGSYFAESLLLTETGASTGAIQIAGTDSDHQLPFFVTTCDYTLIGEELYAASAYLSREPVLVGTLRGQDIGKGFILIVIVLGAVLATTGVLFSTEASDGPARSLQGSEMIFFRRQLPLLITFVTGVPFIGQYYVPHPASEQMLTTVHQVAADYWRVRAGAGHHESASHQHALKIGGRNRAGATARRLCPGDDGHDGDRTVLDERQGQR